MLKSFTSLWRVQCQPSQAVGIPPNLPLPPQEVTDHQVKPQKNHWHLQYLAAVRLFIAPAVSFAGTLFSFRLQF